MSTSYRKSLAVLYLSNSASPTSQYASIISYFDRGPSIDWHTLSLHMLADFSVQEKREELKRRLAADQYITLLDEIVRRMGRMIQRVFPGRPPAAFWYNALMIVLVITLLGLFLSILLGEFSSKAVTVTLLGIGLIYVGMILYRVHHDELIACMREHVVDAIETTEDLADLERWLGLTSHKKFAALLAVGSAISGTFLLRYYYFAAMQESIGYGPSLSLTLGITFYGLMVYYGILFSILPNRLSQYRFRLYSADPGSSELIYHLARLLMRALYLLTIYVVLTTLITAAQGLLVSLNLYRMIGWWIFTTAFFVLVQYNLSKIIRTAKYKKLGEIQSKIDALLADLNPTEKDKREAISWLMDYHDRLKATRNSALDLRSVLEFLNSLLLPLLASLLANLNTIMTWFQNPK